MINMIKVINSINAINKESVNLLVECKEELEDCQLYFTDKFEEEDKDIKTILDNIDIYLNE